MILAPPPLLTADGTPDPLPPNRPSGVLLAIVVLVILAILELGARMAFKGP
jgi:hypothetical protein